MEMVSVIGAMTAISVTGALLVALLLTAETKGAEALQRQTTLARLSRQFRADAHAAASAGLVAADDQNPTDRLDLPQPDGRSVRYLAQPDQITREIVENDQVRQRESFLLPEGSTRFEFTASPAIVTIVHSAPEITLTDSYSSSIPDPPLFDVRIESALNLDSPPSTIEESSN